jgi:hypothetical protein
MAHDQLGTHSVPRQPILRAIVGGRIEPPEPRLPEVGQAGAELVAQQPEQAEDHVAVTGRVAHHLPGIEAGLVIQGVRPVNHTSRSGSAHPGTLWPRQGCR